MRMPVNAAGERFQAVIEMKRLDSRDPNQPIELGKGRGIFLRGDQRISRREDMARIDAHPQPLRKRRIVDDPGEVFKLRPQRRPLPRRRLQQRQRFVTSRRRMNVVQRLNDPLQPGFRSRRHIRPWMHDHTNQPKRFRPLQLMLESLNRLLPQDVIRTGEINQIAVMSDRLRDPSLLQTDFKIIQILARQRLGGPLIVVLRKQLHAIHTKR